jgi:hypothetical protein
MSASLARASSHMSPMLSSAADRCRVGIQGGWPANQNVSSAALLQAKNEGGQNGLD